MGKYKCKNHQCEKEFEEVDPTCCPHCSSTDFEEIEGGSSTNSKTRKIGIIAVGVLLFLFLLIKLIGGGHHVVATITFKEKVGTLKVELNIKDKNKKDYQIILKRNGLIYAQSEKMRRKTFFGLTPGSYYVDVKYVGKGSLPMFEYKKSKGPYLIIDTPKDPPSPIGINGISQKADHQTLKWNISIKLNPPMKQDTAEYSINGKNFQNSNYFSVKPGKYMIYARLKVDESNADSLSINLNDIPKTPPTKGVIQKLLNEIPTSANAFDRLKNLMNTTSVTVTGAGSQIQTFYQLMNDCYNNQYTINRVALKDGEIIAVDVQKN